MEAIGLLVTLEARHSKEANTQALKWCAIKLGPGKFGIFDAFANEAGREAKAQWHP